MFLIGLLQMEWLKKCFTSLYADENILYFNEGSGDAIFNCNRIGIVNNINLDNNFDEEDPDTILLIRLLV